MYGISHQHVYIGMFTPPAHCHRYDDLVFKLLMEGASVNKVNQLGNSALHLAIRKKQDVVTNILLQNRADVNQEDR